MSVSLWNGQANSLQRLPDALDFSYNALYHCFTFKTKHLLRHDRSWIGDGLLAIRTSLSTNHIKLRNGWNPYDELNSSAGEGSR
jgi:hypothetical protein